jgi:hypothetical protein
MVGKKREKPATGRLRKDYDGQTLWYADYELKDSACRDIIKAGGLTPTAEFISAIKAEISRYVYWRNSQEGAPHGGGSGNINDFWPEHACKMIEIYESFGGTYGLGRKNPGRGNEYGSVGSPFLSFVIAINETLPKKYRWIGKGPEYARAIRRAYQNAKSR